MVENNLKSKGFIFRKFIHLASGIIFLYIAKIALDSIGLKKTLLLGAFLLLIDLLIDFFRIEFNFFKFVFPLIKKKEETNFFAITLALAMGLIIFSIFERNIAFAALSISIFGDAAASIVGIKLGKNPCKINPQKTWEGFFAFLVIGIFFGKYFLPWTLAIPMAFVAAFFEILCSKTEDNFFIPLVTAFAGYGISLI